VPRGGFGWVVGDAHEVAESGTAEVILTRNVPGESDVDRLAELATHAGGSLVGPPDRRPWGYTALVADPDGHLWQIVAGAVT